MRGTTILALAAVFFAESTAAQNAENSQPDPVWFECDSSDECVLATTYCAYSAVNKAHERAFESWDGARWAAIGPTYNCLENMEKQKLGSKPVCKEKKCILVPR